MRRRVEGGVDEGRWRCDAIQCHPLVNTSTLVISREGLERFLSLTGHRPRIMRVPER